MANELSVAYASGNTIYALIRAMSDSKIYDAGDEAMEAVGTWNTARVGECDIPLTDRSGNYYTANFPTVGQDIYRVYYYLQSGASPAIGDLLVGKEEINWSGSSVVTTPGTTGSGKTLADLKEIAYYHGWNDTSTAGEAALTRFINRTLSLLAILAPWPEYHKRDGTVTLAAADNDYALGISNIAKIGDVFIDEWASPLGEITMDEWLYKTTTLAATGRPQEYALRKYVSSGDVLMEMLVSPTPTEEGTLVFCYETLPAILALSTDETDWPDYRLWLFEDAVERRIASASRDRAGVALETPEFMALIQKAMAHSRSSYTPIRPRAAAITRRSVSQTPVGGMSRWLGGDSYS